MKYGRIIGLVIGMMVVGGCSTLPAVKAPSAAIEKELDSTVALVLDNNGVTRTYCSGTWITYKGKSYVLTAGHCVRAQADYNTEHNEEDPLDDVTGTSMSFVQHSEVTDNVVSTVHFGKAISVDEDIDIALIKVNDDTSFTHVDAELADQNSAIGETVSDPGMPRGVKWTYFEGKVSNISKKYVMVNIASWYGDSGSALFNSDHKVEGVCVLLTGIPSNVLFIRLDRIKRFLDRECDGVSCKE